MERLSNGICQSKIKFQRNRVLEKSFQVSLAHSSIIIKAGGAA
jgi:hypothetical protein